mmetsp:Transcript_24002/g.38601  ORF Transcript_24002/g.38601 Transcript_24002/m.38601 type:complete len:210 (+) Transcript_24002:806-1435(+)
MFSLTVPQHRPYHYTHPHPSLAVVRAVDQNPHERVLVLELAHPVVQHVPLAGEETRAVSVEILLVQAHLGQSAAAVDAGETVVGGSFAVIVPPLGHVVHLPFRRHEHRHRGVRAVVPFELRHGHVTLGHGLRIRLLLARRLLLGTRLLFLPPRLQKPEWKVQQEQDNQQGGDDAGIAPVADCGRQPFGHLRHERGDGGVGGGHRKGLVS